MEIIVSYKLLVYTANIILLGESRYGVEESAIKLIKSSNNMGLVVNENMIKYMVMNRKVSVNDTLCVKELDFEQVEDLKYIKVNIQNALIWSIMGIEMEVTCVFKKIDEHKRVYALTNDQVTYCVYLN